MRAPSSIQWASQPAAAGKLHDMQPIALVLDTAARVAFAVRECSTGRHFRDD